MVQLVSEEDGNGLCAAANHHQDVDFFFFTHEHTNNTNVSSYRFCFNLQTKRNSNMFLAQLKSYGTRSRDMQLLRR